MNLKEKRYGYKAVYKKGDRVMSKEWEKPQVEMLDIKNTEFTDWFGRYHDGFWSWVIPVIGTNTPPNNHPNKKKNDYSGEFAKC